MRKKEEAVKQKLARLRSAPVHPIVLASLETQKIKDNKKTVYKRENNKPEPPCEGMAQVLDAIEPSTASPYRVPASAVLFTKNGPQPFENSNLQPRAAPHSSAEESPGRWMENENDTGSDSPTKLTQTRLAVRQKPFDTQKKNSRGRKLIADILFFALLAGMVAGVAIYKQAGGRGGLFGYSFYTVLSGSMQSEIPKGSLVIVKSTPAANLQTGDDITFMRDADTVVTHRIIAIDDNYQDAGTRGFKTKGIENYEPDPGIVHEGNVIGKVVRVFPKVGYYTSLVKANLKWIALMLLILVVLVFAMRVLFAPQKTTSCKTAYRRTAAGSR